MGPEDRRNSMLISPGRQAAPEDRVVERSQETLEISQRGVTDRYIGQGYLGIAWRPKSRVP